MTSRKLPHETGSVTLRDFLSKVNATPAAHVTGARGRLIFALDATASREPAWDRASHLQAEMFEQTASLGGLDVQLCYYRGYREFFASPWVSDPQRLLAQMTRTRCAGGYTQLAKLLRHSIAESKRARVNALVFIGDAVEEKVDKLFSLAGELGLLGVPMFVFQEGTDAGVERTFRQLAKLTGGAYCPFDAASAEQLKELLGAVAVYAAGGRAALDKLGRRRGGLTRQLTKQLPGRR